MQKLKNNKLTKRKMPGWEKIIWNEETKKWKREEGADEKPVEDIEWEEE